jgi:cytochrome oxidase Cu insertion factor (SCO1/SenC/PrrC family)
MGARSPEDGRRPRHRNAIIAAGVITAPLLVVAVALGSRALAGPPGSPSPATASGGLTAPATWSARTRPAPEIAQLHDQRGGRFSLAALRGRTVAITFFDSYCRQECPLAGRALAAAELAVPRAQRPVVVVVSVNPLDTPASTRKAARRWGLASLAPWYWLRGTHAHLASVWRAYRIDVRPAHGDIGHTEALYLVDRRGDERAGFLYPYLPAQLTHDLRALAADETRGV